MIENKTARKTRAVAGVNVIERKSETSSFGNFAFYDSY